jgi:hypothetical protein
VGPSNSKLNVRADSLNVHDCFAKKIALHCFWKDAGLEDLIGKEFPYPYVLNYRKRPLASRSLLVFLTNDFKDTSVEQNYVQALEASEDLNIIFICVNFADNLPNPLMTHLIADQNLLNFCDLHLKGKIPVCMLLVQNTIGYIGPAVGNPDFTSFPVRETFYKWTLPNWQSPMFRQEVDFKKIFGPLEYLSDSEGIDPSTEVLIVHVWSVWCKESQKYWNAYEELCLRLPSATHMILHVDGRQGPFSRNVICKCLPYLHQKFLLAKDVEGHFYRFFKQCQYLLSPATFIFVNSKLAYVGEQHITCNVNYFPELVQNALRDPLFSK